MNNINSDSFSATEEIPLCTIPLPLLDNFLDLNHPNDRDNRWRRVPSASLFSPHAEKTASTRKTCRSSCSTVGDIFCAMH